MYTFGVAAHINEEMQELHDQGEIRGSQHFGKGLVMSTHNIIDAQLSRRALMQFADNAGPDQPAHSRRLIRTFVVRLQNQWIP